MEIALPRRPARPILLAFLLTVRQQIVPSGRRSSVSVRCERGKSQGDLALWVAAGYPGDMRITELIWPDDRVAHMARHGVRADEVDEVCFGDPLLLRAKSAGKNPVYYI